MLSGLKTATAFIGVVIGAGFASGQELTQFFLVLGPRAVQSILVAGLLFGFAGAMVVWLSRRWRLSNYGDLILKILGPFWSFPADLLVGLFLFGGLTIMLAGSGVIGRDYFNVAFDIGALVTAIIILFIVLARAQGILTFNAWTVPLILVILILASLKDLPDPLYFLEPNFGTGGRWLLNSLLYVSYNMIPATVLLASLPHRDGSIAGAFLGGITIGITALLLVLAMLRLPPEAFIVEVPILHLLRCFGGLGQKVFAVVLLLAIVSTAIGNLYALTWRWYKICGLTYNHMAVLLTLASLPLTHLGFSWLIKCIYSTFAYLVLILFAIALIKSFVKVLRGIKW